MALSTLERDWAPQVSPGQVPSHGLFRPPYPGVLEGPMDSQFLLHPVPPHCAEWLKAQRDLPAGLPGVAGQHSTRSPFVKAALVLASFGHEALSQANPYRRGPHPRRLAALGLAHLLHLLELAHAASPNRALTAGACTSLLKAWFHEDMPFPHPLKPGAEGTTLEPYEEGVDGPPLTVGGELNKLCHNLSPGQAMAGTGGSTECMESHIQGEKEALLLLREQSAACNGLFRGLSFTGFNGTCLTL